MKPSPTPRSGRPAPRRSAAEPTPPVPPAPPPSAAHGATTTPPGVADILTRYLENGDWREASARLLRVALAETGSRLGFAGILAEGPVLRILDHEGIVGNPDVPPVFYLEAIREFRERGYLEFANMKTLFGAVLTERRHVLTNAPDEDPRSGGVPAHHPALQCFLGVPIFRGGDLTGMIGLANRPGGYDAASLPRVEALAQTFGVLYDSFRRREREDQLVEQLRQAQKMEALGRLAGGVAHDFNNILTAITGYSELILARLRERDPLCKDVEEIRRASERAASLTRQLLAFSRRQILRPVVLDLNAAVRDMERLLLRVLGEQVSLVVALEAQAAPIKADLSQIEQVLLNLAVNARDAMPGGGTLTLSTETIEVRPSDRRSPPGHPAGDCVRLLVADTGSGLSPAAQNHLFEPFFTTKDPGQGTGLGLSTVYGIIHQSGGSITVRSEAGKGCVFTILFPRAQGAIEPARQKTSVIKAPRGTETILLTEDEAPVRNLVAQVLERCGYTVIAAQNAGEALLLSERHAGPIHLLLSDVVMPHVGGPVLAERLLGLRPDLAVLYVSGYTEEEILSHGIGTQAPAFLAKPFTPATLARKVREVLDGHGRR
ncbi:MAG: response regulator [Planctomycetes bacterium]|nr:response regulator [Planctomycetota bacterium]